MAAVAAGHAQAAREVAGAARPAGASPHQNPPAAPEEGGAVASAELTAAQLSGGRGVSAVTRKRMKLSEERPASEKKIAPCGP